MKEIAKTLGYDVCSKKVKRISWMNYKSQRLNVLKPTPLSHLKQMKKNMLAAGEIDVGELIVPIDYYVMKVKKDGTMV